MYMYKLLVANGYTLSVVANLEVLNHNIIMVAAGTSAVGPAASERERRGSWTPINTFPLDHFQRPNYSNLYN